MNVVGKKNETIIYHIIKNSVVAGINEFYIILSQDSLEFQNYLNKIAKKLSVDVKFAFQ